MGAEQKGSRGAGENIGAKDIRELGEPFSPYRHLRPHLARLILQMPEEKFVDGFYAYPLVNGKKIRISSYHIFANPSYFNSTLGSHEEAIQRHREGIENGWGTISVDFKADPGKTDDQGKEIRSYSYTFAVPNELEPVLGGVDLATIFQTTFENIWNAEREAESRGGQISTAHQLGVALGREDIDLRKPVVIASTNYSYSNIESEHELLEKRTDANAHHYDFLEALYNEIKENSK